MGFPDKLAAVEYEFEVNYGGALLYKYTMIMVGWHNVDDNYYIFLFQRIAGTFFDTDWATLLRFEYDGPLRMKEPYTEVR